MMLTVTHPGRRNGELRRARPQLDADHRQADYFLRLLTQGCVLIERQIDRYQKAIAVAEGSGAVDHSRRLRRVMRVEQQEQQKLKGMIDRLQHRFPRT